jgi:GH25 family lysozyme M1 (1,4-beta-N-acetylmuramidase)
MILGCDVSKWQGKMNWKQAVSSGAEYGKIRAGSINNITGVCYEDYQLQNNLHAAESILPIGFYWYFRGNHDPIKQADYYSELVQWSLSRVMWADVEEQGGLTPERLRDSIAKFVGRIYSNLGVWPGIYTRSTVWNPYSYGDPPKRGGVAESALWPKLSLWIARYGVSSPWVYGSRYKPRDWSTWNFWQFSADKNGRGREFGADSDDIDLNWFNGDRRELDLFFGLSTPAAAGIRRGTITSGIGLYIRAAAARDASLLGSARYGSTWEVVDSQAGADGKVWHKLAGWAHGDYIKT